MVPEVHEPANEIFKAQIGSNFSKQCRVFVPSVGSPSVDIFWLVRGVLIFNTNPSERVYTSNKRLWNQDVPRKGVWFERQLLVSELREEDFHINYTCQVYSDRGFPQGNFTLLPACQSKPAKRTLVVFLFFINVILGCQDVSVNLFGGAVLFSRDQVKTSHYLFHIKKLMSSALVTTSCPTLCMTACPHLKW